jgi:hypothetical protein
MMGSENIIRCSIGDEVTATQPASPPFVLAAWNKPITYKTNNLSVSDPMCFQGYDLAMFPTSWYAEVGVWECEKTYCFRPNVFPRVMISPCFRRHGMQEVGVWECVGVVAFSKTNENPPSRLRARGGWWCIVFSYI